MNISVLPFGLLCRIVSLLKFDIRIMFHTSTSFHPSSAALLLRYPFILSIITADQVVLNTSMFKTILYPFPAVIQRSPLRPVVHLPGIWLILMSPSARAFISQQKHALQTCCSLHSLLSSLCPSTLLRLHRSELTASPDSWLSPFELGIGSILGQLNHSGLIKTFWAAGPQGFIFKPLRDQSPVMCPDLGLQLVFCE